MSNHRLRRHFAGLVAVLLLSAAVAPLTAFGDDLPPPAASLDLPQSETSPDTTQAEASPADSSVSLPETPPTDMPPAEGSDPEVSAPPEAPPPEPPELPLGTSSLALGASGAPTTRLVEFIDVNTCYIEATVIFAEGEINPSNGDPVVTLKLERTGIIGKQTWFLTKRFENGALSQTFKFEGLYVGTYELTQLPTMRYHQLAYPKGGGKDVTASTAIICSGKGVVASYWLSIVGSHGNATIRNKRNTDQWCTDTDMAVNQLVLPRSSGGGCSEGDDDDDDDGDDDDDDDCDDD